LQRRTTKPCCMPWTEGGPHAQADNPDPDAHYPVVLAAPAAPQRLAFLPAALDARPAAAGACALALRAAVWRRRPAGVLCVERIEVASCDTYILRHLWRMFVVQCQLIGTLWFGK